MAPQMTTDPSVDLPVPHTTATGPLLAKSTRFFVDATTGRSIFLRGVNLSGNVKQPFTPRLPSHSSATEDFFDSRNVSFVGRPFPLAEADQHFARLHSWGFNFLRFNITWEAIEHSGPGIYDDEYIQYVIQILLKAKQYGFRVFIDPHQDVWSRHCGGSGAPGWTLDLVGLNPRHFAPTNAAIVQNVYPDPTHYPKMIWATNYYKLAAATMFTLFFAGRTFAPKCVIDGVNVQDYLQSHYLNAVLALASAIHNTPGLEDDVVVGYDTLNEPSSGYIGCKDINILMESQELRKGLTPTPLQTMVLGHGTACDSVQIWDVGSFGPAKVATRKVDPSGTRAWKADTPCIWAAHGVWDPLTQTAIVPDYFASNPATGAAVDFLVDFWSPFVQMFLAGIRRVHSAAIIFVEPPVNAYPPLLTASTTTTTTSTTNSPDMTTAYESDATSTSHVLSGGLCFAPHWYDGLTLITKHFNTWYTVDYLGFLRGNYSSVAFALRFGDAGIRSAFQSQLQLLMQEGLDRMGNYPCIIGEIGIPFDMDDKNAYLTGDYTSQTQALDANMWALERSLLNFTLWNYCADNTNLWGDQWNGEDLSIWSPPIAMVVVKSIDDFELVDDGGSQSVSAMTTIISSENGSMKDSSYANGTGTGTGTEKNGGIPANGASGSNAMNTVGADTLYPGARCGSTVLDAGARALLAFSRPFAIQTPGTPISMEFQLSTKQFTYTFEHAVDSSGAWIGDSRLFSGDGRHSTTEIYLPRVHFFSNKSNNSSSSAGGGGGDGDGDSHSRAVCVVQVWVSHGVWNIHPDLQRCVWQCGCSPSSSHLSALVAPVASTPHAVIRHTIRISALTRDLASHIPTNSQNIVGGTLLLVESDPLQGRSIPGSSGEDTMELCPQCSLM
ncbi:hypothetical protein BASA81_006042 [Batrachochytrium salamandrivorans]|nr:hypothetical protein BASA81_006042 [Batrachochytrium salamandrivorans]